MPGGQNSWVDTLSEDWVSQPRSSSPSIAGTIDTLLTGTRSSRALNERSITNITNRRHSVASELECGTMAVRKGVGENNDEWKRHVLGETSTNDLFSKMPLENLFNPPTIGSSEGSLLQPQQQTAILTPLKSRKSYLPVPSGLSTLPEEAGSDTSATVDRPRPLAAPRSDSDPIGQKSRLQSLLNRPTGHRRASSAAPELGVDKKGKRKAERYADIDHDTRSKIILPEAERVLPKPKPRILRPSGRWAKGHARSSSDDVRKNEIISPVSVGELGVLGDSNNVPSSDLQGLEEDDMLGDLQNCGNMRSARKYAQEPESSVYPSSPPIMGHYRSKSASEDEIQHTGYDEIFVDDSKATLASPFTSPTKSPTKTPGLPSMSLGSDGGSLIRKIRQHVDAPKSPLKRLEPQAAGDQESSKVEDDPFFMPHPSSQQSEGASTPPLDTRHSSHDSSKTPMKLFHTSYDTYTAGKLDRRLDEMEKSNVNVTSSSADNYSPSDNSSENERSFSGGSAIVNRLEAMARKSEKENSPSKVKVRYQKYNERTMTEEVTTVSFHRYSSAPSASPGRLSTTRKHRRWLSDESFTAINDGISAPKSPLRDRTPKRLRRSISGMNDELSPASRIELIRRESPRRREHIRTVPEEGSILAKSSRRSRANTMESTRSIENLMGRKGSPTPTPRRKKLPVLIDENSGRPSPAIGSPRKKDKKSKDARDRKIVFSGSEGDGMQGEDFDMPEKLNQSLDKSLDDDVRKSSFTTDYFLQQAEDVMHSLCMREMENTIHEDPESDEDGFDDVSDGSLPSNVQDKDRSILHETVASDLTEKQTEDAGITHTAEMLQTCTITTKLPQTPQESEDATNNADPLKIFQPSQPSRISSIPEDLRHHLATKSVNGMTFDSKELRWVSPGKEAGDDDPFIGVSDLSIDSREEERAVLLARAQWPTLPVGGTPGAESGLWRSSRVVYESEGDRLSSSIGSGSQRTVDSGFDPTARTETRVTSYGTDPTDGSIHKEAGDEAQKQASERDVEGEEEEEPSVFAPRLPARFADDFSSSPFKDDQGVDGFLEHGSLRQRESSNKTQSGFRSSSIRRRSGRSFFGRPVSKISEEDELSDGKSLHPDILNELRRLSLNSSALTPLPTPFKTQLSVQPPSTKRKPEVSFHLTPLRDLSYQFETTEALISLELNYISSRRGPKATSKAVEASFTIAQTTLIRHITDVEPYNPYWEYIKSIELSNRKIETLHTLNEWCPRLTELNVSNNELGQLSGVPEGVLDLKVPKNCLTDATFFGHLVNLQHLDVSSNRLERLDALKACIHLRELKADDNQLTSIDGIFGLEGLKVLRCRRNKIESVDFSKSGLNRLIEIDLRGNQLTEVAGLEALPSLVHVNFDQNQLDDLTISSGTKLPSIRSIKLTQNEFTSFDVSPFPNLRVLYMDNNRLSSINGMTRAKNIDAISFREQDTENGDFTLDINRMFEARKIYLSSNPIASLDIHVPFYNLQYLELSGCQLRSLPDDFSRLFPNLRVLNVNYNRIADLRPVTGCARLEKLLVVGNAVAKIKAFKRTVEKLRALRYFDLRMNPLTLEFYPTPIQNNEKSLGPDEYLKDPFSLDLADDMKDKQFHGHMDMEGRIRRRHYEIIASSAADRLRELDGLKFSHESVNKQDYVFRELVNLGWVEDPNYTAQLSGSEDEQDREDQDENTKEEESYIPEA